MADDIWFKRGTAARWSELNLVLASGEPGFDYTNGVLKIGNGSTPWNSLPAINSGEISSEDVAQAVSDYLTANPVVGVTEQVLEGAIENHVSASNPHPSYDDLPSLTLLFENGLA